MPICCGGSMLEIGCCMARREAHVVGFSTCCETARSVRAAGRVMVHRAIFWLANMLRKQPHHLCGSPSMYDTPRGVRRLSSARSTRRRMPHDVDAAMCAYTPPGHVHSDHLAPDCRCVWTCSVGDFPASSISWPLDVVQESVERLDTLLQPAASVRQSAAGMTCGRCRRIRRSVTRRFPVRRT